MGQEYFLAFALPDAVKAKLKKVISELSSKHGGPVFNPHITILSKIAGKPAQVVSKTVKLAKMLTPFKVKLNRVSFSTTHFQCVFVLVTPNKELMEANLKAKELFGAENKLYMPHISLLYGDQTMAKREKIASTVFVPKISFTVDRIVVVPYAADPAKWEYAAGIKIG